LNFLFQVGAAISRNERSPGAGRKHAGGLSIGPMPAISKSLRRRASLAFFLPLASAPINARINIAGPRVHVRANKTVRVATRKRAKSVAKLRRQRAPGPVLYARGLETREKSRHKSRKATRAGEAYFRAS